MAALTAFLDRRVYPTFPDRWDCVAFRTFLDPYLADAATVVDVGAGAGRVPEANLRAPGRVVWGVDPDPRVQTNPFLDRASEGVVEALPVPDAWADVAVATHVLEHLTDPTQALREVARVLRPGGCFLIKTTNRWHYVALLASLVPDRWHGAWSRRAVADTFPTPYRANTPGALAAAAQAAGLVLERVDYLDGRPEYLRRWGGLAYAIGAIVERTLGRVPACRPVLLATLRKGEPRHP